MAEMTILHIASPFSFSAPVTESRFSSSPGDDHAGHQREAGHTVADAAAARTAAVRDAGQVDARDARSALVRMIDLSGTTSDIGAATAPADAVLAAYQEDGQPTDGGGAEPTT